MLSREGKQTDRGAIGAEFIGYNRRRREALLLQEFPHQPNCRPSVPAGLNQEIQDFALTVHGTPEIELPPSNYDDHLVQVPAFGRSWPPTLNPPRIGPTEFQDPSSNCLIRDVETTLGKQVLNVPIAQRETAIEPDGVLDDDRWKAVTTVGYLAHPETLKHRPCRSHAVNVTMPAQRLRATIRALRKETTRLNKEVARRNKQIVQQDKRLEEEEQRSESLRETGKKLSRESLGLYRELRILRDCEARVRSLSDEAYRLRHALEVSEAGKDKLKARLAKLRTTGATLSKLPFDEADQFGPYEDFRTLPGSII